MSVRPGQTLVHDPAESLIYTFDWTDWLVGAAVIVTSTFTITGPDGGLTKDTPTIPAGSTTAAVRVIGGTLGKTYTLTNTVVTNETPAQTGERSVKLVSRNR